MEGFSTMNFADIGTMGQLLGALPVYIAVIGGMYLFLLRPQQKRRKEEEEFRKNLKVGDEVTTIGGIMGRVVSIKSDSESLVIESGSDKIRVKKWAISSSCAVLNSTKEVM